MVCIVEDDISTASVLWRFAKPNIDRVDSCDLKYFFRVMLY